MKTRNILAGVLVLILAAGAAAYLVLRRAPAPAVVQGRQAAPATAVAAPASCLLPGPAPVPPNGHTATAADMKLGHDVTQAFVEELEAYQNCRNAQIDHAAPSVSDAQKQKWLEDGNAAVDEANDLAAAFGRQLQAYKARHPG